jgi:hypothetical protein
MNFPWIITEVKQVKVEVTVDTPAGTGTNRNINHFSLNLNLNLGLSLFLKDPRQIDQCSSDLTLYHKRFDADSFQFDPGRFTYHGANHRPAPGEGVCGVLQGMAAHRMFRIEAAVALDRPVLKQFDTVTLDFIDEKSFHVTEVLIDLLTIFGSNCDAHTTSYSRVA